jgi:Putative adhesin
VVSDHPTPTIDTAPAAEPRRRRSAGGWALLTAGGVFAIVMILATTWGLINLVGKVTEERQVTLTPANNRISVHTSSGDVRIQRGDTDQIVLTERIEHTFSNPKVEAVVTPGGVQIKDGCRWWASTCRVDFTLAVPDGQTIEVHTSAGDITASGQSGPLDLDTSAGDIHGDGLTSSNVVASTSAGDVTLIFDRAPDDVRVDTSAGDVTVQVPDTDDIGYATNLETSAGDKNVGVRSDPRSPRHISIHTSAGDARVEPT